MSKIKSTTVCAVLKDGKVAIGADGQATMGNTVAKSNVNKIRVLLEGKILAGFAGSTADAFTLIERFEEKLSKYGGNMKRSAIQHTRALSNNIFDICLHFLTGYLLGSVYGEVTLSTVAATLLFYSLGVSPVAL